MGTVGTATGFCASTADIWQIVGIFLLIFKIVIPIILIILGMFDLGKAVISSDDKAIGKSVKALAMRLVAAVIIFFIPTLISFIFSLVSAFNSEAKADYDVCRACITYPNGGKENEGSCNYYINSKSTAGTGTNTGTGQ